MSTKRILLVLDDRLLSNLYREKLEGSGFAVDSAWTLAQAREFLASRPPDVILLDLVPPEGCAVEFIRSLRDQPATIELPLVVFSTGLVQLANAALQAGATKIVARSSRPVAAALDTVKVAAGLPGLGSNADAPVFQPDESWINMLVSSSTECINLMRHTLPGLVTTPPDYKMLRQLWSLVHAFASRAELLDKSALAKVAGAFDLLLADLNELPEQLNGSTVRTIGQAIDFMATLAEPENLSRTEDIGGTRVLVVDDEEGARQFIGAAMQLANLKTETAETPSRALEMLEKSKNDLIFLDIGMPEMDGFALCSKVRGLEAYKKTPIVFITGLTTFHNRAQASLSGGNDFVGKPFNLPELALKALIWVFRGQLGMV